MFFFAILALLCPRPGCPLLAAPGKVKLLAVRRPQHRRGGSSLLSMNMFDRFVRVATANVNNLLKQFEDPEKVLTQAVEDLQKDIVKIRQSYAEVMATQKRTERQREEAAKNVALWEERAVLAVNEGNDELAREALTRKNELATQVAALDDQLAVQGESLSKLYESMRTLDDKIAEAKSSKDQMIARARTAKTATKVNDMISSVGVGTSSMDALERMKDKVEQLETEAEVAGQLAAPASAPKNMEDQFKLLEAGNKVDDELEKMKRNLLASSTTAAKAANAAAASEEKTTDAPADTTTTPLVSPDIVDTTGTTVEEDDAPKAEEEKVEEEKAPEDPVDAELRKLKNASVE